jgi:hypothetical protein
MKWLVKLLAYVLSILGFLVSVQHAYLLGLAKAKLETAPSPDAMRIHSIQNVSITGFASGIIILVIGQVLLYRNLRQARSSSSAGPRAAG